MTFVTGSITSANPGPALYAAIEPTLLANGYTLDDTVVIGTRTHKVLKCAAGNNSFGLEWFLDIHYATTGVATGFAMAPFEGYTAATDQAVRGPISVNSSTIDVPTFSRYGNTSYALETNWANGFSYTGLHLPVVTATITYWASISPECVKLMISSSPNSILYAGFFDPTSDHATYADTDLYPLIVTRITASNDSMTASSSGSITAALTRLPRIPDFSAVGTPPNWSSYLWVPSLGFAGRAGTGGVVGSAVSPYTGKVSIFPVPVSVGSIGPSASTPGATVIGYLNGVAGGYAAGTVSRGDTITVDGVTWYSTSSASSSALFLKAA